MKHLAYALAIALMIVVVPAAVQADDPPSDTEEGPPCRAFHWSLDPPGYALHPECIELPPTWP